MAAGARVVVVGGGAVVTGAPGTVLGGAVVVVDGTVIGLGTTSRARAAPRPSTVGSGTSLASAKYGRSAFASSARP